MAWAIETNQSKTDERNREKHGDEGFEDRRAVAEAKIEEFPKKQWQEAMVYGGQFESIAMSAGDRIWESLREKPVAFWVRLVNRVSRV